MDEIKETEVVSAKIKNIQRGNLTGKMYGKVWEYKDSHIEAGITHYRTLGKHNFFMHLSLGKGAEFVSANIVGDIGEWDKPVKVALKHYGKGGVYAGLGTLGLAGKYPFGAFHLEAIYKIDNKNITIESDSFCFTEKEDQFVNVGGREYFLLEDNSLQPHGMPIIEVVKDSCDLGDGFFAFIFNTKAGDSSKIGSGYFHKEIKNENIGDSKKTFFKFRYDEATSKDELTTGFSYTSRYFNNENSSAIFKLYDTKDGEKHNGGGVIISKRNGNIETTTFFE